MLQRPLYGDSAVETVQYRDLALNTLELHYRDPCRLAPLAHSVSLVLRLLGCVRPLCAAAPLSRRRTVRGVSLFPIRRSLRGTPVRLKPYEYAHCSSQYYVLVQTAQTG